MNTPDKINYLEIPARDIEANKQFFAQLFGWEFVDYGPDYCAFSNQGIDGGFFRSDLNVSQDNGSVLIVFYSDALENAVERVENAGGKIHKSVYPFPGGRRFHFTDPSGNEYAIWSET